MADSTIQTGIDLLSRYATKANETDFDAYVNRWAEKEKEDKLYEDKSTLSFTDMLSLMVAQFQNQSIDNQASTTDMMNQLVQMSSMQAMTEMSSQMQELTLANVMSYSASLVDKYVTIGVYDDDGKLTEIYDKVEGTGIYNGQQVIFVRGKSYLLSSIMGVGKLPEPEEEPDKGEEGEGTETPPAVEDKGEAES